MESAKESHCSIKHPPGKLFAVHQKSAKLFSSSTFVDYVIEGCVMIAMRYLNLHVYQLQPLYLSYFGESFYVCILENRVAKVWSPWKT